MASSINIIGREVSAFKKQIYFLCFMALWYINGIIGSAAAWKRFIAYKAWVAHAAHIHTIAIGIILTPALAGLLANAVNSTWFHHGALRRIGFGGGGSKNRNAGRPENLFNFFLFRQVQDVKKRGHI